MSRKAKLLMMLFSLAMTLVICEVAIRLIGERAGRRLVGWKREDYLTLHEPDDRFRGYVLIPNIGEFHHRHDILEYDYVIRTGEMNSIGYRLHDQSPEAAENTGTVWCFGDSFTFGFGMDEDKTYPALLSVNGYRGINLGVPGFTLLQEYLLFKHHYERADRKPDIVVFSIFWGNDITEHEFVSKKTGEKTTSKEDPLAHVGLIGRAAVRADEFIQARSALYRLITERGKSIARSPEYDFSVPEGVYIQPHHLEGIDLDSLPYNLVVDFLEEAKHLTFEDYPCRFYILLFPSKEMILLARSNPEKIEKINEVSALLKEALKGRKVKVIDYFQPALQSQAPVFYPVDTHFNEQGHKMVTEILLEDLAGS